MLIVADQVCEWKTKTLVPLFLFLLHIPNCNYACKSLLCPSVGCFLSNQLLVCSALMLKVAWLVPIMTYFSSMQYSKQHQMAKASKVKVFLCFILNIYSNVTNSGGKKWGNVRKMRNCSIHICSTTFTTVSILPKETMPLTSCLDVLWRNFLFSFSCKNSR